MQVILLNTILIILFSVCYGDSNITESPTVACEQCSPCWNLFSKNYGPCSTGEYDLMLFNNVQPVCIDAFILLIIMFLSIVILIPTCLWLFYIWIKRCRNIDAKYVVNGRLIS